jgi:hypothetical protein
MNNIAQEHSRIDFIQIEAIKLKVLIFAKNITITLYPLFLWILFLKKNEPLKDAMRLLPSAEKLLYI